ncbi:MAG: hypothetical protein AB8F94_30250 [Saprospiraceae bacterium]
MLNSLNTYRSFLFGLLIISYVFSVFQKPIFETLHFACHLPDIIFSQGKIHSYDSHSQEIHAHENLTAFYDASDEKGETPPAQTIQEPKKKIQIIDKKYSSLDVVIFLAKKQFQLTSPLQFVFIKIPNPPPQFA